jgi:hypothetical protein
MEENAPMPFSAESFKSGKASAIFRSDPFRSNAGLQHILDQQQVSNNVLLLNNQF